MTVVDLDAGRIEAWNSQTLPVYEPNLDQLVKVARDGTEERKPNLFFSTQIDEKIREADLVLLGVNTPTKKTGMGAGRASDLGWLEAATRRVAKAAEHDMIVVEKSTVPCGTANSMREILMANSRPGVHFEVLSNPEFLAEGTAVKNLLDPDRILIGCLETEAGYGAAHALADIYANWIPREKIITMNLWSSELSKLAANAMLAQRISSINALSSICEAVSANIQDVSYAVGLDSRIGRKMMNASVGFGGSCFKKDVLNLVYISASLNLPEVAEYWHSIIAVNEYQKERFVKGIVQSMHNNLAHKKLAVLGFAYKKDTGDTRESAAIDVVNGLLDENAFVDIFDPQVRPDQILSDLHLTRDDNRLNIRKSAYEACQGAHAVIILTEWDMFSNKPSNPPLPQHSNGLVKVSNSTPTTASPHRASREALAEVNINLTHKRSASKDVKHSTEGLKNGIVAIHSTPDVSIAMDQVDRAAPVQLQNSPATTAKKSERIDWKRISDVMEKPMYVFDGRNIVDAPQLEKLGFRVKSIGVPRTWTHAV